MCSLYLGENLISGNKPINLGVRNIGEIVASSLPLTDAGLHLLDGSRLSGDGIYKGFVDYIADLYTENPSANYFCTEAQWQASVTQYGSCGKFVYDSTLNTVRLPKVSDILQGTTDVSALGDLVEAGLPNITGSFKPSDGVDSTSTGCVYDAKSSGYGEGGGTAGQWFGNHQFYIDASRSNSIYGNSNTVQPQTIKVLYYIVVATSTKTDIQVDIDNIATDLNGKVDKGDLAEAQWVVETYQNGSSGYRVWSDGYCEQWGFITQSSSGGTAVAQVTFLKPYKDTNWHGVCSGLSRNGDAWGNTGFNKPTSATQGIISEWITGTGTFIDIFWVTGGYII